MEYCIGYENMDNVNTGRKTYFTQSRGMNRRVKVGVSMLSAKENEGNSLVPVEECVCVCVRACRRVHVC